MKRKITVWLYEPHEMAEVKEGDFSLNMGNYWDFHSGCAGTVQPFADGTEIDFDKEWTDDINRPIPFAEMVAKKINATVEIKYRKTPFEC